MKIVRAVNDIITFLCALYNKKNQVKKPTPLYKF